MIPRMSTLSFKSWLPRLMWPSSPEDRRQRVRLHLWLLKFLGQLRGSRNRCGQEWKSSRSCRRERQTDSICVGRGYPCTEWVDFLVIWMTSVHTVKMSE